jgi:hypothetical protein
MDSSLGNTLRAFQRQAAQLHAALSEDAAVAEAALADSGAWRDILHYKLVPHLAGEGCLIAAVTGGTNTGKSTLFNLLLGRGASPVAPTAAATRYPVLAASAMRIQQCMQGQLVPEFQAVPLTNPDAVFGKDAPVNTLFVVEANLPDHLAILDTPDIDSIDRENWAVADHIRALGDVLIAVLTGEKYRDERVVAFFRTARSTGRHILPVMNKANPADGYAVAREQLQTFCDDVGIEAPLFVVDHDFSLTQDFSRTINRLNHSDLDLRRHLEDLDVHGIKERVYADTVRHFALEAGKFLDRVDGIGRAFKSVADEFYGRAHYAAQQYDPAPGPEIGGLFHEFVQQRRGPVRRFIGATSSSVARGAALVTRSLTQAFRSRSRLDALDEKQTEADLKAMHTAAIEKITRDLASEFIEMARNLAEPAAHLVQDGVKDLRLGEAVPATVRQTLRAESISEDFRRHAIHTIQTWWDDQKGRRRALEALDTMLAAVPAAIAVPLSLYSAGFGVSETVVFVGPIVEQFVARVIEYQFGDAMFDFLSPWRREQRQNLEDALNEHVTTPLLAQLLPLLAALQGPLPSELREYQHQCLSPSSTS